MLEQYASINGGNFVGVQEVMVDVTVLGKQLPVAQVGAAPLGGGEHPPDEHDVIGLDIVNLLKFCRQSTVVTTYCIRYHRAIWGLKH